jgi:hypothetical protein
MKLDPRSMIQYPNDRMKKKDPASSWPILRSFSTLGNRGDRTIREIKFKKKIPTRKRRGAIWEWKAEDPLSLLSDFSTPRISIRPIFNLQIRMHFSIIFVNLSIPEASAFFWLLLASPTERYCVHLLPPLSKEERDPKDQKEAVE